MNRLLLILVVFSVNLQAKNIKVVADLKPKIEEAINLANNGDTIFISSGKYEFSGSIKINKELILIGEGSGKTLLYRSEKVSDQILEGWESFFEITANNVIIENLAFKSKKPSIINNDGLSLALDYGIKLVFSQGFKINDCSFENFGHSAISIQHLDTLANGLISNCLFIHNAKGFDGQGYGYGIAVYGEGKKWVKDPQLGSQNFIFIENCVFQFHRHSIASAGCGKYVFRGNIVYDNIISGPYTHAIDVHEGRGEGNGLNSYGGRASEIYHNKIVNSLFVNGNTLINGFSMSNVIEKAICIRSGDAVVFNNEISGYRFGVTVWSQYTTIPETVNLYQWGNSFVPYISNPSKSSSVFYNYLPNYFIQGRDFNSVSKPNYQPYFY